MACGVTKLVAPGVTATCDNAGTSSHTGLHSGVVSLTYEGRVWSNVRVYWANAQSQAGRLKAWVVGDGSL